MNKKQKKLCLYLFLAFISGFLCSMVLKNFEGFTSNSPPPNTGPPPPNTGPPPPNTGPPPPNTGPPPPNTGPPPPNTGPPPPNTGPPPGMNNYNHMDDEKMLPKNAGKAPSKNNKGFRSEVASVEDPPPKIMKILDKMENGIKPNKQEIELLIDQMMIQMRTCELNFECH